MRIFVIALCWALLAPVPMPLRAQPLSVVDDSGRTVTLAQPAQRIVSLAPHITELLFAAGAGERLVGVDQYSDYPPAATAVTNVGSALQPDLERLLALRPDLVVVWDSGNAAATVTRIEALGLTVFRSDPRRLEDVASSLERLGRLAGSAAQAEAAARAYRDRLAQLRRQYGDRRPVRVFYQIWHQPLMTVNGAHLISAVIELCGGENIFAELPTLAPQVSLEAVLVADPQAIIASGKAVERPEWLQEWLKWKQLMAVKLESLYVIHPDIIQRHTPRILQGAEQMCGYLDQTRRRLEQSGAGMTKQHNGTAHGGRLQRTREMEAQIP